MNFDELELEASVSEGLSAMHYKDMTPVQELSIPTILKGKDVIACAQTGSGKTIAYVLPVINKLSKGGYPEKSINAIIMAPTRELAQQIDQQIEGISYFLPISTVAVYGGTDGIVYAQQERGLQMGADIVIATPGRLIAHMNMGSVDLSQVSFFILDEADRMLDMGFYDDIIQIFKCLPKDCQIILFSATMPPRIKSMAENIMKNPEKIEIAISKPPESILQSAYICYENQKLKILENLFSQETRKRAILFSSSKLKVKELAIILQRKKLKVAAMHSDLEQAIREQSLKDFKNGHIDILVATNVVARGIDIVDIDLIINYDVPHEPDDYIHRIGRTARGVEGKGLAITLVSEKEQYLFQVIEKFLGKDIYKMPPDPSIGKFPAYQPEKHKEEAYRREKGRNRQSREKKGADSAVYKQRHSKHNPSRMANHKK